MNSLEKIKSLSIWSKEIEIKPLEGGITNLNYLVNHGSEKLVVRLGSDIPEHLVYRSNEIIVSKAAYEIGVSPKLIHSEQGVLVLEFIESTTLDPKGVQQNLKRIIPIIKKYIMRSLIPYQANLLYFGFFMLSSIMQIF